MKSVSCNTHEIMWNPKFQWDSVSTYLVCIAFLTNSILIFLNKQQSFSEFIIYGKFLPQMNYGSKFQTESMRKNQTKKKKNSVSVKTRRFPFFFLIRFLVSYLAITKFLLLTIIIYMLPLSFLSFSFPFLSINLSVTIFISSFMYKYL